MMCSAVSDSTTTHIPSITVYSNTTRHLQTILCMVIRTFRKKNAVVVIKLTAQLEIDEDAIMYNPSIKIQTQYVQPLSVWNKLIRYACIVGACGSPDNGWWLGTVAQLLRQAQCTYHNLKPSITSRTADIIHFNHTMLHSLFSSKVQS